ncbi:MAG TPA: extracellular solute-binding protein [Burkholderiaceae bacterium]|nr:extracellular solute-binding protein [Burkholderiaceae bacterium]
MNHSAYARTATRVRVLAWASAAVAMSVTFGASATDIRVWHALPSHNAKVFESLVSEFNRSQSDVTVRLKAFKSTEDIEKAIASAKKRDDKPHIAQLDENRAPVGGERSYVQPLHALLATHPIKNAKWFLSGENAFARDSKGRMLGLPYMAEVPVMYYNIDAFKKAKLTPKPERSWIGLQGQLVELANNGSRSCPVTSDQPVSINLENLAAVNKQPYLSEGNGLKGRGTPTFLFDVMYVRHLSMMISWVRSELMVKPEYNEVATRRFAQGECAVLLSHSGNLGEFRSSSKVNFAVAGLPYYPEVTKEPGNPFLSGSALWVISGQSKEADNASASFLSFLAQPKQAARWHQETGYLPLTQQAFEETSKSYYQKLGQWSNLIAAYAGTPGEASRGFRVKNYPEIRDMFHKQIVEALAGNKPAMPALKTASTEAGKIMKQ